MNDHLPTSEHAPQEGSNTRPEKHHGSPADRRALLTKGGVAAAAAAAAVAGLGVSGRARADDGEPLTIDRINDGTELTALNGSTFSVQVGSSPAIIGASQAGDGVQGSSLSGVGVRGTGSDTGGIGVYGIGGSGGTQAAAGTGVVGESEIGTGVVARGGLHDLEADRSGRLVLTEAGQSGSPSDSGVVGTIARDADGNLWYCSAADSWEVVAGPAAHTQPETPSGTFVPIDPARVFDSRQPGFPSSGLLAPNEERILSVTDGRDGTGAVIAPDVVPTGASAIAFNITVTGTTGPNFVSVVPGDAAGFVTSSINWSGPDQSIANGSIVRVDGERRIKVFVGDQPGSTHAIIDVAGYFT